MRTQFEGMNSVKMKDTLHKAHVKFRVAKTKNQIMKKITTTKLSFFLLICIFLSIILLIAQISSFQETKMKFNNSGKTLQQIKDQLYNRTQYRDKLITINNELIKKQEEYDKEIQNLLSSLETINEQINLKKRGKN